MTARLCVCVCVRVAGAYSHSASALPLRWSLSQDAHLPLHPSSLFICLESLPCLAATVEGVYSLEATHTRVRAHTYTHTCTYTLYFTMCGPEGYGTPTKLCPYEFFKFVLLLSAFLTQNPLAEEWSKKKKSRFWTWVNRGRSLLKE